MPPLKRKFESVNFASDEKRNAPYRSDGFAAVQGKEIILIPNELMNIIRSYLNNHQLLSLALTKRKYY